MNNIELISIANENDEVVGSHVRGTPLEKGSFAMLSCVLLFRSNGNIFLHKIAAHKDWGGIWTYSAAGHVDAGESYLEAAIREAKEEIGLKVDNIEEACVVPFYRKGIKTGFHHVFKTISDDKLIPDPKEIAEIKEFTIDELKELISTTPEIVFPELLVALRSIL